MQTRGLIRALGLAAAPLAMAATLVAAPSPSEARELRIATGTASKNALNRQMDRFAELVEEGTEGAYTGKTYPGTLVSFASLVPHVPLYVCFTEKASTSKPTIRAPVKVAGSLWYFTMKRRWLLM